MLWQNKQFFQQVKVASTASASQVVSTTFISNPISLRTQQYSLKWAVGASGVNAGGIETLSETFKHREDETFIKLGIQSKQIEKENRAPSGTFLSGSKITTVGPGAGPGSTDGLGAETPEFAVVAVLTNRNPLSPYLVHLFGAHYLSLGFRVVLFDRFALHRY